MSDLKKCFNCEAEDGIILGLFCRDCWRMALITSALGASGGEAIHKLLGVLLG